MNEIWTLLLGNSDSHLFLKRTNNHLIQKMVCGLVSNQTHHYRQPLTSIQSCILWKTVSKRFRLSRDAYFIKDVKFQSKLWCFYFKIHDLPENLNSCSSGLLNCSKWVQTYNIIGKILYISLVCLIILFHNEKSIFYLSGETTNVAWSLLEMFWQHPEGASEVTVTTEPESLSPEPELNLDSVGDWVFFFFTAGLSYEQTVCYQTGSSVTCRDLSADIKKPVCLHGCLSFSRTVCLSFLSCFLPFPRPDQQNVVLVIYDSFWVSLCCVLYLWFLST